MLTLEEINRIAESEKTKFDKDKLYDILEKLYDNYIFDKGYNFDLEELLAAQRPGSIEEKDDEIHTRFEDFIQNVIAFDVAVVDKRHAMYLGNFKCSEDELIDKLYDTRNKSGVAYYKTSLLQGVYVDKDGNRVLPKDVYGDLKASIENGVKREYPGINLSSDNSKYKRIVSDLLFPNVEEFKNDQTLEHELTLNVDGLNYADVMEKIYSRCVDMKIPFYFIVRDESEMDKGMSDPIRIYTSTKHIDSILQIIDEIDYYHHEVFKKPPFTTLNVNGICGYVRLNGEKESVFDLLANVITKTVDQDIINYDNLNANVLEPVEPNWFSRIVNLLTLKEKDREYYDEIINHIMEYVQELNVDLDNIYVFKEKVKTTTNQVENNRQQAFTPVNEEKPSEPVFEDVFVDTQGAHKVNKKHKSKYRRRNNNRRNYK